MDCCWFWRRVKGGGKRKASSVWRRCLVGISGKWFIQRSFPAGILLGVPGFELRDAGFAYDDAVGSGDGEGQRKFADGPDGDFLDGPMGNDILAVGTEEEVGVELLHDEVEGFVDGVLLSAQQDGSGEFVLDIETGNLTNLDGDEFVEVGDEEVRAVVLERGGEGRYGDWRRG